MIRTKDSQPHTGKRRRKEMLVDSRLQNLGYWVRESQLVVTGMMVQVHFWSFVKGITTSMPVLHGVFHSVETLAGQGRLMCDVVLHSVIFTFYNGSLIDGNRTATPT